MKWYKILIQSLTFAMFFVGMRFYILSNSVAEQVVYLLIAGIGFYLTIDMEIDSREWVKMEDSFVDYLIGYIIGICIGLMWGYIIFGG